VRLPADAFARATADGKALKAISAAAIQRLRPTQAGRPARSAATSVAVISLDPGIGLGALARRLGRRLEAWGSVARVGALSIDRVQGPGTADLELDDPRQGAVVAWLDQVHAAHDTVIYHAAADEGLTAWVRRCARQADRVFVLVRADDVGREAVRSRLRELRAASGRSLDLVLVRHALATPAAGPWLEDGVVGAHHWLRLGDESDIRRLARVMAKRSVGVVLSGGGAKGFAHLGVLRALDVAGVPVDAAGGTSIGAVMAGAAAFGWETAAREAKAIANFAETRFLIGLTLPVVALSSGRRLTGLLRHPDNFGERAIEDLPRPFFCVSTNLSSGRPVVHRQGPLWWAVRASISIPGVLPPVWSDGDLLADGGIVDDVPVDIMGAGLADRIVAVDLQPAEDGPHPAEFSPTASGWRLLADRMRGRGRQRVPSALQVVGRASTIGMAHSQRLAADSDAADLWLRPPTASVRALDFKNAPSLIEPAYRYACELLERSPILADLTD
jgi:predicted acylesterase/phospholipase RssA